MAATGFLNSIVVPLLQQYKLRTGDGHLAVKIWDELGLLFTDLGQVSLQNGQQPTRFYHEGLPSSPDLALQQIEQRLKGMIEVLVALHCNCRSPMLDVAQRSGPSVAPS